MSHIVSIDIGTTSLCALAFRRASGETVALRGAANDCDVRGLPERFHEQCPVRLRDCCFDLVRDLMADKALAGANVEAIAVTGQMHGVVLVDSDLRAVTNLITWCDERTAGRGCGSIDEARDRLTADAPERCGCALHAGYGGATLFWLERNGRLPDGARALSIADFVSASLCGVVATDPTHAASWGLSDARSGAWDNDSIRRLGIPEEIFPEIRSSCRPLGTILPEAAAALGLGADTVVCSPVGDNQASVIGAGGLDADAIIVNIGTGGQMSVPLSAYRYDAGVETRPMPMGGFIQVGASLCGGLAYADLREFFQSVVRELTGEDMPDDVAYAKMNNLALSSEAGGRDLRIDTRFRGTRGEPDVRGAISGIERANLTPAHVTRALLEGIVRELCEAGAGALAASSARRLVAGGNAVRRIPAMQEIIENAFGLPCETAPAREEAALGAAMAASANLEQP